jgi:prepilin-type N-terminal cleavage/methylation domain-containing protein
MRRTPTTRGYTLVEVLVVVTIIGIIGAIVVPQMVRGGALQIQAAARAVIADILVAQNEAIAQQAPRRVAIDLEQNRYRVADAGGTTITASWQAGAQYIVDFGNDQRFQGVRLDAANFDGDAFVEFDELGAPRNGGTIDLVSGDLRYRITVAPFTGRVTVAPVASDPEE